MGKVQTKHKRVEGIGPLDAKVVFCGEAPGEDEEACGLPFVGKSGELLTAVCASIGMSRKDVYITNVVKIRPPGNKLEFLPRLGHKVEEFYPELWEEINAIKPNLVVALGNAPLTALAGQSGITKWRGSILPGRQEVGGVKVLATYHPAFCLRTPANRYIMRFDLKKVARECNSPTISREPRTTIINPTFTQAMKALQSINIGYTIPKGVGERVCIDLETYRKSGLIRTIAFATSPYWAICIPILKGMKPVWSTQEEVAIWTLIRKILLNPRIKLIAQNAQFELTQLLPYTNGAMHIWMDTLRAHALIYPEFPHSLAFLNSIYTDMPYYKDEGGVGDDGQRDFDQLQEYNCKDVLATYQSADKEEGELKELALDDFYHEYDNRLSHTLWRMQMHGVLIDREKLEVNKVDIDKKIAALTKLLIETVGYEINPKSTKQMRTFLYDKVEGLGLPKRHKRSTTGEQILSVDASTLEALYAKHQKPELKILLEIRRLRTLKETFLEMSLSPDGRIRTSFGVTETGRLSSSKDLFDVGANLQNIPRKRGEWIREIFIPSPGKLWLKADLAQADARVVAWLARDENLRRIFNGGEDIHRQVAALIFDKEVEGITKKERELAKAVVHATNYGMKAKTFSEIAGISQQRAQWCINSYHSTFPNIRGVFQADVERQLQRNRTLTTPFGRRRTFFGHWGDTMFREAYAYIPQSTVADYINEALPVLEDELPKGAQLLLQVHDELDLEFYPGDREEVVHLVRSIIQRPIIVNGEPLTIPVEVAIGPNWAQVEVVKDGS